MSATLAFTDLACLRGDRILFEGLSARLAPGDALVLSGPNGAGKSSLIRIIAGLLPASAGRVVRDGAIGLIDERTALDPRLPLARAIGWWAGLDGTGDRVTAALDAMALSPLAEVPVRFLSTGQRKRAGMARLIAQDAPVWLLDEPGNGLDAAALGLLAAAMMGKRAGGGIVVAATHQPIGLDDAARLDLGGLRA